MTDLEHTVRITRYTFVILAITIVIQCVTILLMLGVFR